MVSPKVALERRTLNNYRFEFENPGAGRDQREGVWTLYMEGGISAYLPAGDSFDTLQFKNRIELQLHDLTRVMKTRETNANTLSLRYGGLGFGGVLPVSAADLNLVGMKPILLDTSDGTYLKDISYPSTLLVVPGGSENLRILNAAMRKIGGVRKSQTMEFANRAITFLQDGRGYSLENRIPAGDAEIVLRWVESGQDGHCELYAGALVLISRYAGIPARLVTGYAGGDWNGYENYYMVRNRNAHAWVELFDKESGWIRVDPTPGYLNDPGSVSNALAGGGLRLDRTWQAYVDSLKVLWFRRVIQFDSADQALVAESVKGLGLVSFDWLKDKAASIRERLKTDWKKGLQGGDWSGALLDLVVPAGVVAALVVVIYLLQRRRRKELYETLMRRKAGQLLTSLSGTLPETARAHGDLLRIRYGPAKSWPEEPEQFLRKLRRHPKRFVAKAVRS
jgi:hypothetical protein